MLKRRAVENGLEQIVDRDPQHIDFTASILAPGQAINNPIKEATILDFPIGVSSFVQDARSAVDIANAALDHATSAGTNEETSFELAA